MVKVIKTLHYRTPTRQQVKVSTFGPQYRAGIDELQWVQQKDQAGPGLGAPALYWEDERAGNTSAWRRDSFSRTSQLSTSTFEVVTAQTERGSSKEVSDEETWQNRNQNKWDSRRLKEKEKPYPSFGYVRQWKRGPGRLQSSSSEVKTQLNKALSNWVWPCFEQMVEDPSILNYFMLLWLSGNRQDSVFIQKYPLNKDTPLKKWIPL